MYSSMCFMSVVALLVMDVRTGALQDRDIQSNRCYNCRANDTTSCERSASWTSMTCPAKRPMCATIATAPDFRSSLVCAAIMKKPCAVRSSVNSSIVVTCVCNSILCNAPFSAEWRNELINFTSNNVNVKQEMIYELFNKYTNKTEEDALYKTITAKHAIDIMTANAKVSSQTVRTFTIPATVAINSILRDSERPRAEALKQEPTVPSDDDEDESEGSGSYEESRIHNHAVSAPAAPSSFLPANENSASLLYKDLLVTTLFIYFVI